jgi:hypothetical protein
MIKLFLGLKLGQMYKKQNYYVIINVIKGGTLYE